MSTLLPGFKLQLACRSFSVLTSTAPLQSFRTEGAFGVLTIPVTVLQETESCTSALWAETSLHIPKTHMQRCFSYQSSYRIGIETEQDYEICFQFFCYFY
jgi:hypothetical protein